MVKETFYLFGEKMIKDTLDKEPPGVTDWCSVYILVDWNFFLLFLRVYQAGSIYTPESIQYMLNNNTC